MAGGSGLSYTPALFLALRDFRVSENIWRKKSCVVRWSTQPLHFYRRLIGISANSGSACLPLYVLSFLPEFPRIGQYRKPGSENRTYRKPSFRE